MRVLVFGKTGQVARELQRRAEAGVTLTALDRAAADLADPAACAMAIHDADADVVINAAAYTDVDRAEEEKTQATVVNEQAPAAMAQAAAAKGVPFLHVSTDYVFAGDGTAPWLPEALTGPLGVYGRSKLAGEESVRGAGGTYAILRTSWVFSAHGNNFVRTMLRLGQSRDTLNIVNDQIGGPTAAADIADALLVMAATFLRGEGQSGIYHFAGTPETSWDGFAREIFLQMDLAVTITGIPSSDYPTPARRPLNSRLDCSATETVFDIRRPDWRVSLAKVLNELTGSRA